MLNRGAVAMKRWRKGRGYNQLQAATRCGFSQSAWGRYELGLCLPPARMLALMHSVCEIDPTLFFEEVPDPADEAGAGQSAAGDAGIPGGFSSPSQTQNPGAVIAEGGPGSFSAARPGRDDREEAA